MRNQFVIKRPAAGRIERRAKSGSALALASAPNFG
jgi:hypothetical protein